MKKRKVLVLNKSWIAVGVTSLERAIGILFCNYKNGEPKAVIVETEEYDKYTIYTWEEWADLPVEEGKDCIRTVNRAFRIPEVIRLSRYDKTPNREVVFSRKAVLKRDNYTCCYCGIKLGNNFYSIDHVVAKSKFGPTNFLNCVTACQICNLKKANKSLEEAGMKLLKQPYKPSVSTYDELVSWKYFLK